MLLICLRREAVVVVTVKEAEPTPLIPLVPVELEIFVGNPGTFSPLSSLLRSLRPLATAACSSAANKAAVMASLLISEDVEAVEATRFPVLSTDKLEKEACSNI